MPQATGATGGINIQQASMYTVITLPTALAQTNGEPDRAFVYDALNPVWLQPVVGGGSTPCPVFYDASQTKWICG